MDLPYPKDLKSIANVLYIEHHVQRIITQQEINGVRFDLHRGSFYVHALRERQIRLYIKIRPSLHVEVQAPYGVPIRKPFRKDGTHTDSVRKWYAGGDIPDIGGQFTRIGFAEPDLKKRTKLVAQLLRLGWRPQNYTEKGNPRLVVEGVPCPSLETISSDLGRDIADWYIYKHREGQIQGLINLTRSDRRISAKAITIGTPTFRFRHRGVVNIPKAHPTVKFGKQMRSLFTVDRGRRLVGHDAKGLELRTLAHFIDDEDFTREVVEGDPHTKNQRDAGLPTRDDAKTFIYAFIYGAGDTKLGSILSKGRAAGARMRRKFLQSNPSLAKLIKEVTRNATRGYLLGLDGRKIFIRKDKFTGKLQTHKALNSLNQTAGAVVMKWAMVLLDGWAREAGLDAMKVIDMHDESQADVLAKDVDMYSYLARQSIIQAGKELQLNVPLDADVKVGHNWSETH